jgi:hypothetical protein
MLCFYVDFISILFRFEELAKLVHEWIKDNHLAKCGYFALIISGCHALT